MVFTTDSNENRKTRRPDDYKMSKTYMERGKGVFRNQAMFNEDDDYSQQHKGRKSHDNSRGKNFDAEDMELSDKLENFKRFEREKKAVQKKSLKEEDERRKRPVLKQKRSSKDLTRDYNYGLLDEEVFM